MLFTKAELLTEVRSIAAATSASVVHLGGDCYAAVLAGEPRFAVALKECTTKDNLWIGSPAPLLDALSANGEIRGATHQLPVYRAFILVSHLPFKTVLLIPAVLAYQDALQRARVAHSGTVRMEFHVLRTGYKKYALQTDTMQPNRPITVVDSFEPLKKALSLPLDEVPAPAPPNER